jgi:hypothetical protein
MPAKIPSIDCKEENSTVAESAAFCFGFFLALVFFFFVVFFLPIKYPFGLEKLTSVGRYPCLMISTLTNHDSGREPNRSSSIKSDSSLNSG